MTKDEITARARAVVIELTSRYGRLAPAIQDTTNFVQDMEMDSIDRVDLVMGFEDEFLIEITDDEADTLPTFGDVVDFLVKKLSVAA